MKHRWVAVLFALTLTLAVPGLMRAQGATPPPGDPGQSYELGQNSPNPFSRSTSIPFSVGDAPACTDPSRTYRVTMQIFNVLAQPVAVPLMQGSEASGQPVVNLMLPCGSYMAVWEGDDQNSAQPLPTGVYLVHLQVDGGRPRVRRMLKVVR
jgi:hypothetical protein